MFLDSRRSLKFGSFGGQAPTRRAVDEPAGRTVVSATLQNLKSVRSGDRAPAFSGGPGPGPGCGIRVGGSSATRSQPALPGEPKGNGTLQHPKSVRSGEVARPSDGLPRADVIQGDGSGNETKPTVAGTGPGRNGREPNTSIPQVGSFGE